MTYDVYRYIFFGGAGLAGLSFVITVILFFVLKIPRVVGDLTGATARKAIENIRNQNENREGISQNGRAALKDRGSLTDKITGSGRIIRKTADAGSDAMMTTKISTQQLNSAAQLSYETSLLTDTGNETTLLSEGGIGETTVLDQNNIAQYNDDAQMFVIEYEITFIHTNEVIA